MAKTKLTLSVDASIIRRARRFAERHNTTVSELVTDFLASLEDERKHATPVVASLRGLLPSNISREAHPEHLRSKHACS